MEIRYINSLDDRMAISRIYEECWKYSYKDIMPEEYLNLIEEGKWSSVDNFIEENFGGKQLRAVMFVHYRYK